MPKLIWPSPLDKTAHLRAVVDRVRVGFDARVWDTESGVVASVDQVSAAAAAAAAACALRSYFLLKKYVSFIMRIYFANPS